MNPKINAKGIFLDLDGTIVDSTGSYIEAARITFKALGKNVPQPSILLEIPRRIEQRQSIDDLTHGNTKQFMAIYLKAYYSISETQTKLLPNVASTLKILAERSKLALITMRHCPNQVIYKELDYLGVAKYFSQIVTAMDTPQPKPSPQALLQSAEILKLNLNDCIVVGDSINDVRAGKAAGAKTVALLSGLYQKEELAKESPDLILPDVNSLPDFIQ
jgi:phosphoglycolate phosphatase